MNFDKFDPKKLTGKLKIENSTFDSFTANPLAKFGLAEARSTSSNPKNDLDLTSIFDSVKKGVQTGVNAAVKAGQDTRIRFSLEPAPGDPNFVQWKDAMKMVARLPEGVPEEFRRKLWLNLSEKYLERRGIDWSKAEKFCFNEWTNPDDDELGMQIVRDLHRTGCSLFCGEDAESNQLMLKRVLLAYARWNKSIGYCQGFNMLAAIILEVMEKQESEALQVMIFMIEGILPECYFTNNLRGLSVDMAVFRDLLKLRLPKLSKHLDDLQREASDGGPCYEPPLTNVFTMQWFLTLFSTCLPRDTVLRVWDLILLEGNEVLLRTALAIWTQLEGQILTVKSADEFYCAMGQLSSEMMEYGIVDTNKLIKILVEVSPFPFSEINDLREKYTYNITPWSQGLAVAKRGLKILYSDDEDNMDEDEDDETVAVAATFGISAVLGKSSPRGSPSKTRPLSKMQSPSRLGGPSLQNFDKDRLSVDITALKHQYAKLRQRQKQAHIILTSGLNRTQFLTGNRPTSSPPVAMNHLLLGKKPLGNSKPRKGPPPGSIPVPKTRVVSKERRSSSSSSGTSNRDATQYICPQPEIVTPVDAENQRHHHHHLHRHHHRKSKEAKDDEVTETSAVPVEDESRETNLAEAQQSLLILIQDHSSEPVVGMTSNFMRISKSSCDVSSATMGQNFESKKSSKSETDLIGFEQPFMGEPLSETITKRSQKSSAEEICSTEKSSTEDLCSNEKNRSFIDEILLEFDKSGISSSGEENNSQPRADEECKEKRNQFQVRQHSLEASQLIKENSEILERLSRRQNSQVMSDSKSSDGLFNEHPTVTSSSPNENPETQTAKTNGSSSLHQLAPSNGSRRTPGTTPRSPLVGQSKPITFNPFPTRQKKKPKEIGLKLGLYPAK